MFVRAIDLLGNLPAANRGLVASTEVLERQRRVQGRVFPGLGCGAVGVEGKDFGELKGVERSLGVESSDN